MIPSLDGDLYTFDGEEMGYTPFSADSLLSSSIKMADDTLITGGKEIKLYGINRSTGQVLMIPECLISRSYLKCFKTGVNF